MCKITQALHTIKRRARPFLRSATVYVGALIVAMPDIAPLVAAHAEDLAHFIPRAWLDPSMRLIGVLVLLARARTLINLTGETPVRQPGSATVSATSSEGALE